MELMLQGNMGVEMKVEEDGKNKINTKINGQEFQIVINNTHF